MQTEDRGGRTSGRRKRRGTTPARPPAGLHVLVARGDGAMSREPLPVEGVAAQMVLAILSHQDEINNYGRGAVELHWGPNGVQGRLSPLWEHTIAPELVETFLVAPVGPTMRWHPRAAVREFPGGGLHIRGTEEMPPRSPA
jgi:hypothetical protein